MSETIKTREQRVRRVLAKSGMRLIKGPALSTEHAGYGAAYMVVNEHDTGPKGWRYEADLRKVEWFAFAQSAEEGTLA